jgi:hypothetical protein
VSVLARFASFINDVSNIVWLADTNYRIDLDNDSVRSLAHRNDFDGLLAADQVMSQAFFRSVLTTLHLSSSKPWIHARHS